MTDQDTAVDQNENRGEVEPQQEELTEEEQEQAKLQEAISVEKDEIGSLRLKLTITVPRETIDERMGGQFSELKRDADVPGFRKGRAPMRLIEKRFASDVGHQVISQLVSNGYLAAVKKEDLNPLGDPLIWTTVREQRPQDGGGSRMVETEKLLAIDEAAEHIKLPSEGALTFAAEIELRPQFDLPKLDKIPLERPALTIEDKHIEAELDRLRSFHGIFALVEDGKVEADDLLIADVSMTIGEEEIISEANFDLPARDTRVKGINLDGFKDAVVGKAVGDEVSVDVTAPDDHENISIRGKSGAFSATLREIKRFIKAPLDETFLQLGGYESEEDLRSAVRSALEAQLGATVKQHFARQVKQYLLDNTEFELPEGLPQRLTEQTIARRKIEMMREELPPEEIEKAADEMRAEAYKTMVREMKLLFILEKVAEDREIRVAEEEINGAIAGFAARQNKRFDRVRDELAKSGGMWNLYLQLRDEKVLEGLIGDAEITEAKPAKKSPKKKKSTKKKD